MSNEYRKTFDELVALYELEPTVRDVFVEGPTDAALIRWFLRDSGVHDAVVYEIDTVEIPRECVQASGFDVGMRGRVLALAQNFEDHHLRIEFQVTLIADRDLDEVLGRLPSFPHLLLTDYACIDMYLFRDELLHKFLDIFANKSNFAGGSLVAQFSPILVEASLLRAAKLSLGLNLKNLGVKRFLQLDKGRPSLDRETMISQTLNVAGMGSRRAELDREVTRLRGLFRHDCRATSNGHDFLELFTWYLRKAAKSRHYPAEIVHHGLTTSLEYDHISSEAMFQDLKRRLS